MKTVFAVSQLLQGVSAPVRHIKGDEGLAVTGVGSPYDPKAGTLVFVESTEQLQCVTGQAVTALVIAEELLPKYAPEAAEVIFSSSNVRYVQSQVIERYFAPDRHGTEWGRVHPSAVIHESAAVPDSVVVHPGVVIGKEVRIGENCVIFANAVIEHGVSIGAETVIHANVVIKYDCVIGSRCMIESGVVIGSEGFKYVQDEQKKWHLVPHLGIVVIEDDVHIGANTCVDRSGLRETRIGRGTKIDNLCQVAHNVVIGQDCAIAGATAIAGSVEIGDRVRMSGQVGLHPHLKVASDVDLVYRAGVISGISEPGVYAGLPATPLVQYQRMMVQLKQLDALKRRLSELEKKLADLGAGG